MNSILLGGMVITKNSGITIATADHDSATQTYAARELHEALKAVTGAELAIAPGSMKAKGQRIIIGRVDQLGAAPALQLEGGSEDEILVQSVGDTLYLTGPTDRAALYATYTFLERHVGVRWLWPGETGTFYPEKREIEVEDLKIRHTPSLQYRDLAINTPHYDNDTLTWLARQRANVNSVQPGYKQDYFDRLKERGFLARIAGHHVTLPETLLDQHPEWRAEYAGKRQRHPSHASHLCWSNPGVQEALREKLTGWIKTNPALDIVSLYTADHNMFCTCASCVAMAPDVSTRWQKLSRLLISALKEVKPDLRISSLAYQAYRPVPDEVAPYDTISYTTYNISYRYPFSSGYKGNRQALDELAGWQARGAKIGMRGYEMIATARPRAFLPLVYLLLDEMKYAVRHGFAAYSTEVGPYGFPKDEPPHLQGWNTNRINLYAVLKAMWDASITEDELLEDWCHHAYGAAAPEMKAYYRTMEQAWRETPGDVSYFLNPTATLAGVYMNEELLAAARRLLKEASAKAADQPRHAAAVKLDDAMFGTWEKHYRQHQAAALRFNASAIRINDAAGSDPAVFPWETARTFPAFLDKTGAPVEDATEVKALWDDKHLYLRILCRDANPQARVAHRTQHDDSIWSDDSIEFFINRAEVGYDHLAANSIGTRYEARTEGGMGLDKNFAPEWKAVPFQQGSDWGLYVTLPFSWVEKSADGRVALSINRNRPQRTPSGWPDVSVHNPSAAGFISLVNEEKPRVLLYDRGADGAPLMAALREKKWAVARIKQLNEGEDRLPLGEADLVTLFYGGGKEFQLSHRFFHDDLLPFLKRGGLAVIASSQRLPIDEWLNDPELAVQWSGWKIARPRVTLETQAGRWQTTPNDLTRLFRRSTTPSSGLIPTGNGWTILATMKMADDRVVPYLMVKRIGKGMVVLTSSNFGYSGGYEMFGQRNTENIALLLENLYANRSIQ